PPAALEVALDPALHAAAPALEARLAQVTRALADELGLIVPPLMLAVDARLPLRGYEIRLHGTPLADGIIPDGRILVDLAPGKLPAGPEGKIDGLATEHPQTGAPASWVPASSVARLPATGLMMLDGPSAIAARLDAALRAAAPELVGLDETQRLLDAAAREHPALVRALVPARVELTLVAEVLRRLVAEGVGLRDLPSVLEALARAVAETRGHNDPAVLTERVRAQLTRVITHRFATGAGGGRHVSALMLDADAEEAVRGALRPAGDSVVLALEPDLADALLASVEREAGAHKSPIILTSTELRRHVRRLVEGEHPRLPVLAYQELLSDVEVEQVGTIRITE
ncbi:MAG: FHIPEP family type III secretion protein, partial [Polyangia bacterium]